MPYINLISTSNPDFCIPQNDIANFMSTAMDLKADEERKLKAIFRISGIKQRYSVLSDYRNGNKNEWKFYPANIKKRPTTADRMLEYQKNAFSLAENSCSAVFKNFKKAEFTHLITVSCTGMYAPGLDIELIKKLDLPTTIERHSIQFMGCFAAFNAVKNAYHICNSIPQAKVLIVCVELCTLHFQNEFTEDNLLANTLFADGAASVVVSNQKTAHSLSIVDFKNVLHPNSENEMAWNIGDNGFQMKLSSYVPAILSESIEPLAKNLIKQYNFAIPDIKHFAIHPGGKRILESVAKALNLTKNKLSASYKVLENYGNMSSPTILFVLKELLSELNNGEKIVAFAFGPGLTMESMLLEYNT